MSEVKKILEKQQKAARIVYWCSVILGGLILGALIIFLIYYETTVVKYRQFDRWIKDTGTAATFWSIGGSHYYTWNKFS